MYSNFPLFNVSDSIPGVGGSSNDDDEGESKEEQMEQERLRQEAIKQAERERREKYKKQEDEREVMRQSIRDKVRISVFQSPPLIHTTPYSPILRQSFSSGI